MINKDLRRRIVQMITKAGEGHIPSAFSIVDIVDAVYAMKAPEDRFILSKGHGCAALYVVLAKHGLLTEADLESYGGFEAKLGGHPDRTKATGVECSTGSLGHGLPMALGLTLGNRIQARAGRVIVLLGDGEAHEGTTWEAALVAHNLSLSNLLVVVDDNKSAAQICPHPSLERQWEAFGWSVMTMDGHNPTDIAYTLDLAMSVNWEKPTCIIAKTIKGYGVPMLQGHGKWHHRIPNKEEYREIMEALADA